MANCRNCGHELKPDLRFCSNCGTQVEAVPESFTPVQEPVVAGAAPYHIFVCENSVANDNSSVFVYDLAGKLQYTLGDKKFMDTGSLGIVPAIVETANGFMVLDGTTEDLSFWNKDGSFIDKLECRDLFGFSYGSVSGATLMPDGSIIIGVTLERTDESAMEYVFSRTSGF